MEFLEKQKLNISPPPHIHSYLTRNKMFMEVVLALLPILCLATGVIGLSFLFTFISIFSGGIFALFISNKLFKENFDKYDLSSLITIMIVSVSLPSGISYSILFMAGIISIFIGKNIFGGTGNNIFNPAMFTWVILSTIFPLTVSGGNEVVTPFSPDWFNIFPHITTATPLIEKGKVYLSFFSLNSNVPAELSIIPVILGIGYLFYKKVISYHIPLGVIVGFIVTSIIVNLPFVDFQYLISNFFAGGLIFAAFFVATDPVTTPVKKNMKVISGLIVGIFIVLVRKYTNLPDGVAYAVLISNLFTPFLNHLGMKVRI